MGPQRQRDLLPRFCFWPFCFACVPISGAFLALIPSAAPPRRPAGNRPAPPDSAVRHQAPPCPEDHKEPPLSTAPAWARVSSPPPRFPIRLLLVTGSLGFPARPASPLCFRSGDASFAGNRVAPPPPGPSRV